MSPAADPVGGLPDTRYLSISEFQRSLAPSVGNSRMPFPVESGCKDTTFFQTCKFFFRFFPHRQAEGNVGQRVAPKKKFQYGRIKTEKHPKKTKKTHRFFTKFGVCTTTKTQLIVYLHVFQYIKRKLFNHKNPKKDLFS